VITNDDWDVAKAVCEFLKGFFDATNYLSAYEHSTSPLAIHKLYEMSVIFKKYEVDELLGPVFAKMKEIWKKYFVPMPNLYCYAFVLDPRIRFRGLKLWFQMLSNNIGFDYNSSYDGVWESIVQCYSYYENKYGGPVQEIPNFSNSPVGRVGQISTFTELRHLRPQPLRHQLLPPILTN